ncbi:hypothetical protein HDV05_002266 [Chytridiales sp. JEL 0842]|nr:hypothetical protein HDV05_002266 [Chytridiales sp. JEL 0842]
MPNPLSKLTSFSSGGRSGSSTSIDASPTSATSTSSPSSPSKLFQPISPFKKKSSATSGTPTAQVPNVKVKRTSVTPSSNSASKESESTANDQEQGLEMDPWVNGGLPKAFGRVGVLQGLVRLLQTCLGIAALWVVTSYSPLNEPPALNKKTLTDPISLRAPMLLSIVLTSFLIIYILSTPFRVAMFSWSTLTFKKVSTAAMDAGLAGAWGWVAWGWGMWFKGCENAVTQMGNGDFGVCRGWFLGMVLSITTSAIFFISMCLSIHATYSHILFGREKPIKRNKNRGDPLKRHNELMEKLGMGHHSMKRGASGSSVNKEKEDGRSSTSGRSSVTHISSKEGSTTSLGEKPTVEKSGSFLMGARNDITGGRSVLSTSTSAQKLGAKIAVKAMSGISMV